MVSRIIKAFSQKIVGLHEAAYLLGSFAVVSQLLALVRDRLLAHYFGAGATLDIYYAAFRIPDLIFVGVASMVSLFVLIPFLADRFDEPEQARSMLNSVITVFSLVIVLVSVVVYFFIPNLVEVFFPGIVEGGREELIRLTRILLLSPILLGLSNLFASITQVVRRFFVYALSPVFYNIGIIIGIIALYPMFGLEGLAYGVVLGALMHALIQVPVAITSGLLPRLTFQIDWDTVKAIVTSSLPRTLALAANQGALLVLIGLASVLDEGSIAIFNLAHNLQSVPLSIIGVSYSVAAFPTLARLYTDGEKSAFTSQIILATKHIVFWSFPVLALFIVLRAQIVRTVLGSGAFGWEDTRLAAAVLALFAVSLIAQGIVLLYVRGYYAAGQTVKPLAVNVFSATLIVVLAYVGKYLFTTYESFSTSLESILRIEGIEGTIVIVLPIAYSIGYIVNALIFRYLFARDFGKREFGSLTVSFVHGAAGAAVAALVAYATLNVLDDFLNLETLLGIFSQGLIAGVLGLLVAGMSLHLLGNKEIAEVREHIRHKFWQADVVGVEPEDIY